jgi:hypothetical protein
MMADKLDVLKADLLGVNLVESLAMLVVVYLVVQLEE